MKQILYFSLGAASGALVAWYLTKRRYEGIIDEEIEEVKERYKEDAEETEISERKLYRAKVRNLDYISDEPTVEPVPMNEELLDENGVIDEIEKDLEVSDPFPGEKVNYPYTIGPEAYLEEYDGVFDKETITYWAGNDTLVTDADEILQVNDTIGRDNLKKVGEYEEGTVFVRNERLGMDFEVIFKEGNYEPD